MIYDIDRIIRNNINKYTYFLSSGKRMYSTILIILLIKAKNILKET